MSTNHSFTPVPRQSNRKDGWTPQKQADFIDALAEYGMVRPAAQKVAMNTVSAYRLRAAPGGESFAAAWDEAIRIGQSALIDVAMDRAINGVTVPVFHGGKQIGERNWHDNRLLMFMLKQIFTRRFGRIAADFDFVDETLAAEKAQSERRAGQIETATNLRDALADILDDHELITGDNAPSHSEIDEMARRRDSLDEMISNLRASDPAAELARFQALAPSYVIGMRRKPRAERPEWMLKYM